MHLMPIVYITDMNRSIAFYEALGLRVSAKQRNDYWTELSLGDAILALHKDANLPDPHHNQRLILTLVTHEPLENLVEQLGRAGIQPKRAIADEAFGRSLLLHDPDGLPVQINEHEAELYT
jgi:catechol 2,3-dioxygenase-like lactoylglutathione lyase family enzyme